MTPDPATPPTERRTFDQAVCDRLRAAFQDVFLHHPEVKCLSAAVTWNGELNDAGIQHGVWLAADGGPVKTPDGVIASLHQTMRMLDFQFVKAGELLGAIQDQIRVLGPQLVNKREELEGLKTEIEAIVRARAGLTG